MHVMYMPSLKDTVHFGTLAIDDGLITFKSGELFISLRDARVKSFGSIDDDYAITVVGFEANRKYIDQYERRTIDFYPDTHKMWTLMCHKTDVDPRKVDPLPV